MTHRTYNSPYRAGVSKNLKKGSLPPPSDRMDVLACANCEYDAPDIVPPRRCPKCSHDTFYRRPRPGSLLEHA